jgi:hypothetical protein
MILSTVCREEKGLQNTRFRPEHFIRWTPGGPLDPFTKAPVRLKNPCKSKEADARTRTGDPFITSEVLYQLSYVGAADPV